jgi:hypothetical protein
MLTILIFDTNIPLFKVLKKGLRIFLHEEKIEGAHLPELSECQVPDMCVLERKKVPDMSVEKG